jgi:dolichol kinase
MKNKFTKFSKEIFLSYNFKFFGVLFLLLVHQRVTREMYIALMLLVIVIFVIPDVIRQYFPKLNDIFVGMFEAVIRENEVHRLSGNSYLLSGVLLIVLIFPPKVVGLSLLFLAFADPIASCIGILYGKHKILGQKSLQGFLAAFTVCTLATAGYLFTKQMLQDKWLVVSVLGGLIGALSELLPIGKLDDNLTLPLLSAGGLTVLFRLFGAAI